MDSLEMAEFLFVRIQETIDNKQYIKEVEIWYEHDEIYGNEFIRLSYIIRGNEKLDELSFNDRQALFNKSSHGSFSIATYKDPNRYNKKKRMLRILEFKHLYEGLAAYAILQLEKSLHKETPIKVKSIDLWPEGNYAEKYFLSDSHDKYSDVTGSHFENDIFQWDRLHELAKESKKIYAKEKSLFSTTDVEINGLFHLKLDDIRYLLLHYNVPIKIKGIKTIDEIHIHVSKFVEALKKEMNDEYVIKYKANIYKGLINFLYDHYLQTEKGKIIQNQQSELIKQFILQKGDVLQLKDMRIVMTNAVSFDQQGKIHVEYAILKTNLQLGERTRIIEVDNILYVLKEQLFLEFISGIPIKHISLLNRWMSKRKIKLNFKPFEPDLTRNKDSGNNSLPSN